MSWFIKKGTDTPKTLAEWGFKNVVLKQASQAVDELTFTHPVLAFDADPVLPEGTAITLLQDAAVWFSGTVLSVKYSMRAGGEAQSYRAVGPWYWLENHIYHLNHPLYINTATPPDPAVWVLDQRPSTHAILNLDADLHLVSTRDQITTVLNYAISRGANLQIGTIDIPEAFIAIDEVRDISCAEVIRKQLRVHPDAIAWFNHAETPPSFNVRARAQLTPAALALGVAPIEQLDLAPMSELQRSAIVIRYERTDMIDGQERRSIYVDAAPAGATGLEEGALAMTVNLRGISIQNAQGELECEPLPTDDAGWIAWFKEAFPNLKDARYTNLALVAGTAVARTGELDLPNELIAGPVANWMRVDDEPVVTEKETFTIHLKYEWKNAAGTKTIKTVDDQVFTVQRESTNGVTGTYYGVEEFTPSEPQPLGLAAHEYAILNRLELGGTVVLKETECTGLAKLGTALNLTGFQQAAWATMAEPVQSVVLDFDRGVTTAQFGPPGHLDIPTILSLIR